MIIILLLIITFFGVKFAPKKEFFENSFSIDQTRALKGLFAIAVMLHHLYGILLPSFLSIKYFRDVGYLMVGGFFLISGYGLMYGVLKKKDYLKGFFRKRILALLIPYYLIDFAYVVIRYYSTTDMAAFKTYVIESIFGLQLWFVPVMVLLYVLFRLSFIGYGKMKCKYISPIILTAATLVFVIAFTHTQHMGINVLYGSNWNDTALCFTVGMWYCLLKDKIRPVMERFYYPITVAAIALFGFSFHKVLNLPAYVWPTSAEYLLLREVSAVLFCVVVLLLSMKVRLGNGLLNLCGDLSFEIYLSHAIFITLFRWGKTIHVPLGKFSFNYLLNVQSDDLYCAAILISTLIFSFAVHKLCGLILKPLRKSAVKK